MLYRGEGQTGAADTIRTVPRRTRADVEQAIAGLERYLSGDPDLSPTEAAYLAGCVHGMRAAIGQDVELIERAMMGEPPNHLEPE